MRPARRPHPMVELFSCRLFSVLAAAFVLVLATLVLMSAAFVLATATFVLVSAAGLLTGLSLAAVLGATVDTGLAVVGSAGGVLASALVMALVFANLGFNGYGISSLLGSVVVASRHAESESGSYKSG